jgi:hypothetical protein
MQQFRILLHQGLHQHHNQQTLEEPYLAQALQEEQLTLEKHPTLQILEIQLRTTLEVQNQPQVKQPLQAHPIQLFKKQAMKAMVVIAAVAVVHLVRLPVAVYSVTLAATAAMVAMSAVTASVLLQPEVVIQQEVQLILEL